MISLLQAMDDPQLFGPWFQGESWSAWKTFLRTFFALPLSTDDLSCYQQCTARSVTPDMPAREAWVIAGRRSGKSFVMSLVATYLATFRDYRPYLAPGERATIMCIAADRRQARTVFRYIKGLLEGVPLLSAMIERITTETIDLNNSVSVEVHTNTHTSVRGYTIAAALADEIAYWPMEDAASSDAETIAALRPAMATIPGSVLCCLSSPYSKRGSLWQAYKRHYGKDGDVLVWQSTTRQMNPTIPESVINSALDEDFSRASSEYLALFRSDLENFISREVIDACVIPGRYELPPMTNTVYQAFTDPAGGSGADSFTLAVSHIEGDVVVLDCIREVNPPFSPDRICREFAATLKAYGLSQVGGDRYAGSWPAERFQAHGIAYRTSERTKSELYLKALPLLNAGRIELLDNTRLLNQLASLERRTARSGKDSVDHSPGSHDDLANAMAGALVGARGPVNFDASMYELEDEGLTDWSVPSLLTEEEFRHGPTIW